jgi:hypothetical protein
VNSWLGSELDYRASRAASDPALYQLILMKISELVLGDSWISYRIRSLCVKLIDVFCIMQLAASGLSEPHP